MAASELDYINASERLVGAGHVSLDDTLNRALRDLLEKSGYNPDAAFTGLAGPVFNVVAYGAVGDGVTDDTAAIQAAADAAATAAGSVTAGFSAKEVTLIFPFGHTFAVESTITLSYKINVQMFGRVLYTGSADEPAVVYGSTSASEVALNRRLKFNVVRSVQSDWTSEANIGLDLVNIDSSFIDVVAARNFTIGVNCRGVSAGFVYNELRLGYIFNNKVGLNLTNLDTAGVGWCNENAFIGGRFGVNTGVNSTLQRWGIRITSDSTSKYYNNNNDFYKPSLELNNAGSGAATPIYIPYGQFNGFHDARQEGNDQPLLVVENNSTSNEVHFGYSSNALPTITDDGTYPATYLTQRQRLKLQQPSRLIWHSGPLHKLACYSDGGTNINVPTVNIGNAGNALLFTALDGFALNADYLEITGGRGVGIFVDTRNNKEFVVRRDVVASFGGRVGVVCYDSGGSILTSAGGGHPYAKGLSFDAPAYSSNFGGSYQTGSDGTDDVYFKVGANVAYVRVMCLKGSANLRIRSFSVFAVGQNADAAAWTGVDEIIPGVNLGTTPPTSGTWTKGRVVLNSSPDAGEPFGWICVTAGTPGTWVPFGRIEKAWRNPTTTDTVLDTDRGLFLGGTTWTLTLQSAATRTAPLTLRSVASGTITVQRAGSDTVEGATSIPLAAGESLTLMPNGTDWLIVG